MCCYQVTVIKVGDCHRQAGSTLRPGRERMACHRLVQRCLHDDHHPDRTTEPQVHALRPATDQGLGPSAVPVASRHPASAPWDRHHDAADSAGWLSLQVPHPRRDRGCGLGSHAASGGSDRSRDARGPAKRLGRFLMPHTRGLADAFGDSVNGRSGAFAGIGAAF